MYVLCYYLLFLILSIKYSYTHNVSLILWFITIFVNNYRKLRKNEQNTIEDDHHKAARLLASLASDGSTDTVDNTINFGDGNNMDYMSDTSDEYSGENKDADAKY